MIQQFLANCVGAESGTGLGQCSNLEPGDLQGIALIKKGEKFTELNKTSFEALIESRKLHQFLGIEDFEVSDAENEIFTSSQGYKKVIRRSKPTESLTFRKGMCYDRALFSFVSNGRYDVIKYFDKGVLVATTKDGQYMKGFNIGMADKNIFSHLKGNEHSKSDFMYQLVDSQELDLYWVFIPYTALDFDPLAYVGVIQTNINVVSQNVNIITIQILDNCSGVDLTSLIPTLLSSFTLIGATIDTVSFIDGNIEIAYTGTPTAATLNMVQDANGNYYTSGDIPITWAVPA